MNKLQIIFDKNKKSKEIRNLLIKKINFGHFNKSNLVIVVGGDGFMLETLKNIIILKKSSMELIQEIMVF